MLHSYLKGAKLRAWLSRPECPPAIQECKVLLDRVYNTHTHSYALPSDLNDIDSFDDVRVPETWNATYVPEDLQELIHRRKVVLHAHVKTAGGVVYSRCSTHLRNSLILFYPNGNRASPAVPGCIIYIYEQEGSLHFAVRRQCVLPPNTPDPFAAYPHFPARMYLSTLEVKLEHVKISWVVSHYARWTVSDAVVVLSLSRVSSTCFLTYGA